MERSNLGHTLRGTSTSGASPMPKICSAPQLSQRQSLQDMTYTLEIVVYIKNTKLKLQKKKETWKTIIQLVVSILTAIATTLGVTSCIRG